MANYNLLKLLFCLTCFSCNAQTRGIENPVTTDTSNQADKKIAQLDTTFRTIHVFVALCDNKYQGIVPVPAKIGNGQDPDNNLYWGCRFGMRAYFKSSKEWKLVRTQKPDSLRLERLIFKHVSKNYYLIAEAYDGKHIEQCTKDFLQSSAGQFTDTIHVNSTIIGSRGNAQLLAYIGHDGLMDFRLEESYKNTDNKKRDVIILACYSKRFFAPHLTSAGVNPLVWTTGLMSPEAYTLHDAIAGYVNDETNEQIRTRAASAYAKYQKCSQKAARNLLTTGW